MPPVIALALYIVLLIPLLRHASAQEGPHTWARWVPAVWVGIVMTRLPSQWLEMTSGSSVQAMEEGNWLDRCVWGAIILLAFYIVSTRSVSWRGLLAGNHILALLLLFTLLSTVWSDYPDISFKRWIRDLGSYLTALVILSDPRPLAALDAVIRRVCYVVVPLSVVLIKYYPELGVTYDQWIGVPEYQGATLGKNSLGSLCLVSGIFFFWDTVRRWPYRRDGLTTRTLLVNGALIGMTLWLLWLSNSATSQLCLLIACLVVLAAHWRSSGARPLWLKVGIPISMCLYLGLEYLFGINSLITSALGREPTLTGRTEVWEAVIPFNPDPLLGAGYEGFWLGHRLMALWMAFWWQPNQAHNGYIEVYLNLGFVGLLIVGGFLVVSYYRIWTTETLELFSLGLTVWVVTIMYNVTEAVIFKGPLWLLLLANSIVISYAHSEAPIAERTSPAGIKGTS
jgi:exopolysaccharide production protein ExoQ